jgi:hypothetical protein
MFQLIILKWNFETSYYFLLITVDRLNWFMLPSAISEWGKKGHKLG